MEIENRFLEWEIVKSLMKKKNYILLIIKVLLMISFIGLFLNTNTLRRMHTSTKHKSR